MCLHMCLHMIVSIMCLHRLGGRSASSPIGVTTPGWLKRGFDPLLFLEKDEVPPLAPKLLFITYFFSKQ